MSFSAAYSLKNNEVTVTNCDREPVHIPGVIQSCGALLVLDPQHLTILQASDNSALWFGIPAEIILSQSIATLIGDNADAVLRQLMQTGGLESLPRYVFTQAVNGRPLDFLAHLHDGLLLVECEAAEAVLPVAQDRLYAEVNRITGRMQQAPSLLAFSQMLAEEVRHLTGLDRVMIYRFQEDLSGEVFAEARRDDLHSYMNLRYPADDIPAPARAIFTKIRVRPVPDVAGQLSEMVPLVNPVTRAPLDMTYCCLRGPSVMYTDYLKNMGVAMALTLSIVIDGKLWGLIACHHTTPKTVPWPIRAACELLSQIASLQLRSVETREFADYRLRMQSAASEMAASLVRDDANLDSLVPELRQFMNADSVAVFSRGIWTKSAGAPKDDELVALAEWLQGEYRQPGAELLYTHHLSDRFPPAAAYADKASGLLAFSLSRSHDEWVLWFRAEFVQTVSWAGDPYHKPMADGPHGTRLMPRTSFALWQESVCQQSLPWQGVEIDGARHLRLALMEVIVARAENTARLNRALASSNAELDAFAYVTSHDLREPLRGIYHHAYYLKGNAESRQDAESITRADSLLRLTKRMDGLIESLLHFSRMGRTALEYQEVDMNAIVDEALDMLYARRAEVKPTIIVSPQLPKVQADPVRVREIFANLIGNALKYTEATPPVIEIGHVPTAYGQTFFVRDNGIGIAESDQKLIFQIFKRLHAKDDFGGGSGAGLAIVEKIVERHRGRIWLDSTPGQGTVFYFTLEPKPE